MKKPTNGRRRPWGRVASGGVAALVTVAAVALPSVGANALPSDDSEAQAQVLRSTIFPADLAGIGLSHSALPSDPGVDNGALDLGVLAAQTIEIGGVQVPLFGPDGLIDLGELGALTSYSDAVSETNAKAAAGLLGEGGSIAVSPGAGVGTDPAYVDLTRLFDQLNINGLTDQVLDQARLEIGALAAEAETNAGTLTSDYVLAGIDLNLRSPLVGGVATTLGDGITSALGPVSDLVASGGALDQLLTTLQNTINALSLGGAGVNVTSADVQINGIDAVAATVVQELIAEPLTDSTGAVTVDLGTGLIHIDIAKLIASDPSLGGDINNLPPNTDVISDEFIAAVVQGITESIEGLTNKVTDLVLAAANELSVNINIGVEGGCLPIVGCTATGGVEISGTLAQFAGTDPTPFTTNANLVVAGVDLGGALLTPVVTALVNTVNGVTGPLVLAALNAVSSNLTEIVQTTLAPVYAVLDPIGQAISSLLQLRINDQPTLAGGVGDLEPESFTIRALSLTLLPGATGQDGLLSLALASATVRALAEEPVSNVNAAASAAASAQADASSDAVAAAAAAAAANADATSVASAAADASANAAAAAAADADASTDASASSTTDANAASAAAANAAANADASDDANASASTAADANAASAAEAAATADSSVDASAAAAANADATADATAAANADVNAAAAAAASAQADASSDAVAAAAAQAAANADATSVASAAADASANAAAAAHRRSDCCWSSARCSRSGTCSRHSSGSHPSAPCGRPSHPACCRATCFRCSVSRGASSRPNPSTAAMASSSAP
ncbi:choice-of-anchor G family protein [Microbacterium gorillae]|uniref:choice-of-anchor G family protein n=1 Tax=Microbacterium gorillae TaxID=1231063 RepID=UPI001E529C6B|nr:choice-of-anchor G family protein [Microbacterium gorillae]